MRVKESETVRSFLAIEIEKDLIPKISKVQDSFKETEANIKYVSKENMHFTLKFFGDINEDKLEEIELAIKKVLKNHSSFDLTIEGCGNFPKPDIIKIIWIGIAKNEAMINLQKDLDKEFKKIGFRKEKKFISHLTIGRPRNQKNKNELKNIIKENKNVKIGSMKVSKIHLKKSTLTPKGPIYEDIKVFDLN
ncbi:MAG: RNA 2',3'-cyclic phosphodiesterase [archaeon]|nr:RNA 2',3'-cyclic phosphodiesterase [archaeon]